VTIPATHSSELTRLEIGFEGAETSQVSDCFTSRLKLNTLLSLLDGCAATLRAREVKEGSRETPHCAQSKVNPELLSTTCSAGPLKSWRYQLSGNLFHDVDSTDVQFSSGVDTKFHGEPSRVLAHDSCIPEILKRMS